jgi:uncharacterized membrane protein HdeD (DUF308 family)
VPALDDFLEPLFRGVKEVIVPKPQVTDQLDQEWKQSKINLPSPNMLSSYRKGRLHVHEYEEDYRVHMDRYDPEKHAILHLVDDAPLLLMVWGTVSALSTEARSAARGNKERRFSELKIAFRTRMILGALVIIIGLLLVLFPTYSAEALFSIVLPLIFVGLGAFTIYGGIGMRRERGASAIKIGTGAVILFLGVWIWFSWESAATVTLIIVAVWFLGSALLSLSSALKGRRLSSAGFWPKLVMGCLSLALGIATFVAPKGVLSLLMIMLGVIAILAGILLLLDGLGLRRASKDYAKMASD